MEIRYYRAMTSANRSTTLKEAVEREQGARNMSLHQIANAGGPSYKTLQRILRGEIPVKSDVYRQLDEVFGWRPGTARLFAGDGSTIKIASPESTAAALSTLTTLRNLLPEEAKTEPVTRLLDLLHDQIATLSD